MSNPIPTDDYNNPISKLLFLGSAGALTSRLVQWVSDKVSDLSGRHLGQALRVIIPSPIRKVLTAAKNIVQYPIYAPKNKIENLFITDDERINLPDDERERKEGRKDLFMRVVYYPVLEEIVYRGVVQTGISLSLEMLGTNPMISKTISVFCTTVMFGIAHEKKLRKNAFTSSAVAGLVMGILKEYKGLPSSIVAHMLHNFSIILLDKLSKSRLFKRSIE
jgi:hypothetical protein